MAKNAITGYNSFSMFAKHMNDEPHHYSKSLFSLLAKKLETKANSLEDKYPELSKLWETCSQSCKNIHEVLNGNYSPESYTNEVEQYAEDIITLDYRTLSELITNVNFEYSSSMPRRTVEDGINLSEQKEKLGEIRETIKEELTKLYKSVQKFGKVSQMFESSENEGGKGNEAGSKHIIE